jgi:hypothetical protein
VQSTPRPTSRHRSTRSVEARLRLFTSCPTLRRQLPRAYAAQADSRNKRLISDGSAPSPSGKFVFHSAETGSTVVACPPAVGWETVNGRTERTALVWERSL